MSKKKSKDSGTGTIALNKKARFEYSLEDRYEAGLALQGWEVKALRAGRISFNECYAIVRGGELFLFGAQITPLNSASTHVVTDDRHGPTRVALRIREVASVRDVQRNHAVVGVRHCHQLHAFEEVALGLRRYPRGFLVGDGLRQGQPVFEPLRLPQR
jgi:tmRNA-binding protein